MNWRQYFTTDATDPWIPATFDAQAGEKVDHVVYGAALWAVLERLPLLWAIALFAALVVGWEVVELVRWIEWTRHGSPQPRPQACDLFSPKDLVRASVGALLILLLHARF